MAKKVLVTGCSGYLGDILVRNLLSHPIVAKVVAMDLKAPNLPPRPKFKHLVADIRDEFLLRSVLEEEAIDTVFHLAFMMADRDKPVLTHAVNVGGTLTVFDACNKSSSVTKLVITSSCWAYGARRGNPARLTEEHPLRASSWPYGLHKRLVEAELAKSLPSCRRNLRVAVLRLCTVVGPSERTGGPVHSFCAAPAAPSILLSRGALQFLSETDFARVMNRAMENPDFAGTYNVAPDTETTIAALCRRLGKTRIPLPYVAAWLGLAFGRRFSRNTALSEDLANILAFPVLLSNEKIKKNLGISFEKGSEEAFLEAAAACAALPPAPSDRPPGAANRDLLSSPRR